MSLIVDVSLKETVHSIKDDANPTSWCMMGMEGKDKLVPLCQGTGEAEEYWEAFLSKLKPTDILYAMVRVTMGDSESRRPKFIFLVWLGSGVGMMKKARVAIQKADVMRLTGDTHLQLQTDSLEELALEVVKSRLKKSMGADYDMGSNSRSADGKQGNAGSNFAPVAYVSKMSGMKAQAAAAYAGLEHAPKAMAAATFGSSTSTAAAPKTAEVPKSDFGRFHCIKKSQIRAGSEMDSEKAGIMGVGELFNALSEPVHQEGGNTRVHTSQGWVSMATGAGVPCLAQLFRCVKKSQIRAGSEMASEKAGILSVGDVVEVSHRETLESGALRMQFAAGWVSLEASNGAAILDAC